MLKLTVIAFCREKHDNVPVYNVKISCFIYFVLYFVCSIKIISLRIVLLILSYPFQIVVQAVFTLMVDFWQRFSILYLFVKTNKSGFIFFEKVFAILLVIKLILSD